MRRYHANDLSLQPERVPHGQHAADPGTQADRHIRRVNVVDRTKQFRAIAGNTGHQERVETGHHVQRPITHQTFRELAGGLQVLAAFDEQHPQASHDRVLLTAVAQWHDSRSGNAVKARGVAHGLPVIPAGRGDDLELLLGKLHEVLEADQASADLERTDRSRQWFRRSKGTLPIRYFRQSA